MRRKVELIHQIRAMEAAPISRNKMVDFTETAGYRFLNEMSIAEVIFLNKATNQILLVFYTWS